MDCQTCRKKLSALHEGELGSAEADEIRAHLRTCPKCAREYRRLSAVVSAVRNLEIIEPPADMLSGIRAALDEEDARRSQRSVLGRIGPIIAAAACVIIVVGVVLQQGGIISGLTAQSPAPVAETASMDTATRADEPVPSSPDARQRTAEVEEAERAGSEKTAPTEEADESVAAAPETPDTERGPPHESRREMSARSSEEPNLTGRGEAAELASSAKETEEGGEQTSQPPSQPPADAVARGPSGSGGAPGGRDIPAEATYMQGAAEHRAKARPLMKSAKRTPRVEKLQARFIPPRTRQVGRAVTCAVEIESATNLPELAVRVETREGVQVPGASDGYIYRGPVTAGKTKTIEFRIHPRTPGTHRVRITLETPDEKLKSQMEATLPGFAHRPREQSLDPLGEPVSVDFRETPVRHALLEVARQGRINLVLDSSETGPRVTYSCEDTPAGAVVRIIAEDAGYSLQFEHDTYFVGIGD